MRRLSGELLQHFRNLVVVQALGPNAKSLTATPDQIKVLVEQAKSVDAGRVFRICDQIADMEDKLRYVLSVRTLIEMSLIRASRIATTATIEELMRAVRALRTDGGAANIDIRMPQKASASAPVETAAPVKAQQSAAQEPARPSGAMSRQEILDDDRLNDILAIFPGSTIVDIKEPRR
jgi:DNA polymerase III gamma/tau subunit